MKSISELAAARVLRSRCSASVLRKYLKDKDFSSEEIEPVIESFIEYGYLDDLQYCRDFIAHGERKGWGELRIKRELRKRELSSDDISVAFDEKAENTESEDINSEADRALAVALKVVRQSGMDIEGRLPEKLRNRIIRRLSTYGYGSSIVFSTLSKLDELARDETLFDYEV